NDDANLLGHDNAPPGRGLVDFRGQISQFRVWKVARTEAQIRETMFGQLSAAEPGLAGLWNFEKVENGVVKDSGPGAHDARLRGGARVVPAVVPAAGQLAYPSSFIGTISDASGRPISGAIVQLIRNGITQTQVTTATNGDYKLGSAYTGETYDVAVL